jgi:hypothetical protein
MFDSNKYSRVSKWLNKIGEVLDLTPAQYKAVEERYTAVAAHLSSETSALKIYKPEIKPQGSFLLGTMIKPLMQDDELDIDLVCRLTGKQPSWTQFDLKQAVGDQLKASEIYQKMLDEEGNRCWTLLYGESTKFHMDILPAIVGRDYFLLLEKSYSALSSQQVDHLAIKITDKRLANHKTERMPELWPKSNPFGYAAWFKDRATMEFTKAMSLLEAVEPLPDHVPNKEPLKRIVQLLKRHRDIMFGGDEHKPISIIITTLAAKAYKKETNIAVALLNILNTMDSFIETKYSNEFSKEIKWIANPVNKVENFADKWPLETFKEESFYNWLTKAREDFSVIAKGDYTQIFRVLKATIGSKVVDEAAREVGIDQLISENYLPANFDSTLLAVSHRERVRWPQNLSYNAEIQANYKQGKDYHTIIPSTTVPKECYIYFVASTNVPRPFEVYWQVVNTGEEARSSNGLRGGIFSSQTLGVGGLKQKDYSAFKGQHWIECFIVKNNICVARSYEFMVKIG